MIARKLELENSPSSVRDKMRLLTKNTRGLLVEVSETVDERILDPVDHTIVKADAYFRDPNTQLSSWLRKMSGEKKGEPFLRSRRKSAVDVAAGVAILPIVTPVVLLSSAAVVIEDGHAPFYSANRIGKDGKWSKTIKLRSLRINADQDVEGNRLNEQTAGISEDPRATRTGRILRKFNIDELPQVVNLLNGTMALFGARGYSDATTETIKEYYGEQDNDETPLTDHHMAIIARGKQGLSNPVRAWGNGKGGTGRKVHLDAFYTRVADFGVDAYGIWSSLVNSENAAGRIRKRVAKRELTTVK